MGCRRQQTRLSHLQTCEAIIGYAGQVPAVCLLPRDYSDHTMGGISLLSGASGDERARRHGNTCSRPRQQEEQEHSSVAVGRARVPILNLL